jgi:hypothetical protein
MKPRKFKSANESITSTTCMGEELTGMDLSDANCWARHVRVKEKQLEAKDVGAVPVVQGEFRRAMSKILRPGT